MITRGLFSSVRTILITLISIFGLSLGHGVALQTDGGMAAMGHGQNKVQCQSTCLSALPAGKQEEFREERDDDEPNPEPVYALSLLAGSLALLYAAKKSASFLASWRPPDLIRLYGRYLFYA